MATLEFGSCLSNQTRLFAPPALRQITLDVLRVGGVNLGQGVCNLPTPDFILERAHAAMLDGVNRYTNPKGLASLRRALAVKLAEFNKIEADPDSEILVTCGVSGAFETVCGTLLNPGDGVLLFEPSYPYHVQALKRYQAEITCLPLSAPDLDLDFNAIKAAITPRTKFILVNTPGNPTGKVWTAPELERLGQALEGTECLIVTDEIYEYMAFDGRTHVSAASIPELRPRTITMGGYSKTFSITGWRIGYLVAPRPLAEPMTSFLDAVYVCPPAPLQQAVADGIDHFSPAFYADLCAKYQSKRDHFIEGLKSVGMTPESPQGAYYLLSSYENLSPDMDSVAFARRMIDASGVGAVPSSDFVRDFRAAPWIRFCLANEDSVLEDALERLGKLRPSG